VSSQLGQRDVPVIARYTLSSGTGPLSETKFYNICCYCPNIPVEIIYFLELYFCCSIVTGLISHGSGILKSLATSWKVRLVFVVVFKTQVMERRQLKSVTRFSASNLSMLQSGLSLLATISLPVARIWKIKAGRTTQGLTDVLEHVVRMNAMS
jgi:hypothetical protein